MKSQNLKWTRRCLWVNPYPVCLSCHVVGSWSLSPPLSESTDDVGEEPGLGLGWQHSKYKFPSPYVGVLCHPSWRFTHILTKIEIDITELFLKVQLWTFHNTPFVEKDNGVQWTKPNTGNRNSSPRILFCWCWASWSLGALVCHRGAVPISVCKYRITLQVYCMH